MILTIVVAAAALRLRGLGRLVLAMWIATSVALAVAASFAGLESYPWNNLLVLSLALSLGVGIGRAMPPRLAPMLALLLVLSVLDVAQVALTSGPPPGGASARSPAWLLYINFRVVVAGARIAIGVFDLALAAAVAVHLRRRMAPWPIAIAAAPAGLVLAELFVVVTGLGDLPLIPFLSAGWITAEAIGIVHSRAAARPF